MLIIKLKEAILRYERKWDRNLSFEELSDMTGIPMDTLRSIASRRGYHTTMARLEKLCLALDVPIHDLLEIIDDPPKSKRKKAKKKGPASKKKRKKKPR